jgi:hypothetical protein
MAERGRVGSKGARRRKGGRAAKSAEIQTALRRIGRSFERMDPAIGQLIENIDLCKENHLCWSAKIRAANIVVKIIKQTPVANPKTLSLAGVTGLSCPLPFLIEGVVADEIHKKVDKNLCGHDCPNDCQCVSFPLVLTIGHDKQIRDINTDDNWKDVGTKLSVCRTQIDIEFDIQLVVSLGVCIEKEAV